jgi:CheY-like chemotaxis protein
MGASKTILLVEDNQDDVFIFKRVLKTAGITHRMEVLTSGQEVVEYLSRDGKYADREKYPFPSVVFLDLKIPHLDGFEVLNWIRQQPSLQSVAVAVLSGSDDAGDQQRAAALGALSYLVKPPEPQTLRQLLDSAGDQEGNAKA